MASDVAEVAGGWGGGECTHLWSCTYWFQNAKNEWFWIISENKRDKQK